MSAPARDDVRVYHLNIWRYLVMWWMLGPFVLLGLGIFVFAEENTRGAGLAIVLLMAPFLLLWHWLTRRARLEISPRGARVKDATYDLEAPWAGIVGVHLAPDHEGFITAEPLTGKGAERLAGVSGFGYGGVGFYDEVEARHMAEKRFLPLRPYGWALRKGDLAEQIARHAPHLEAALASLSTKSPIPPVETPPETPAERRKKWLVVGIVTAAFAWGFVLIWKGEVWQVWFFTVAQALLKPGFTLIAAWSAWSCFRARSWLLGILFAIFAVLLGAWTLTMWHQLAQLFRSMP